MASTPATGNAWLILTLAGNVVLFSASATGTPVGSTLASTNDATGSLAARLQLGTDNTLKLFKGTTSVATIF
jgi:hypothetical protein